MDNLDAYLKLVELEMKLYNAVNDVVISAVREKYKNISPDRIHYSLKVLDNESSNSKSNSTPESNSSIKSREDRLKYMRACQKNWRKPIPRGGGMRK